MVVAYPLDSSVTLLKTENLDRNARRYDLVFRRQNDTVFSRAQRLGKLKLMPVGIPPGRISFMIAEHSHGAHSAQVKVRLRVNGASIRITHMGPDLCSSSLRLTIRPARRPFCSAWTRARASGKSGFRRGSPSLPSVSFSR
ncbi:hypothetical protein SBV1_2010036 [Verrucomicrobia bacterium]|nr:hypothetical protein SBV1_2010036 [Verrucomicrobiota bacterium]